MEVKRACVSCSSKVITVPAALALSQTSASVLSQVIFSVKPVPLSRGTAVGGSAVVNHWSQTCSLLRVRADAAALAEAAVLLAVRSVN